MKSDLTTKFRQALDASGRDMWLNFHCDGAYQDWCAEDGNSWRIGQDHHDLWSNTESVIETLAAVNLNNQTGPYHWVSRPSGEHSFPERHDFSFSTARRIQTSS